MHIFKILTYIFERCQFVHTFYEECAQRMPALIFMYMLARMLRFVKTLLKGFVPMETRQITIFTATLCGHVVCVQCDKKHILDCPDFSVSGKCSKGDKCPLRHRKRVHKRRSSSAKTESSKEPKAFKRRRVVNQPVTNKQRKISDCNTTDTLITPDQLEFIPLEQGPSTPPDFIAL